MTENKKPMKVEFMPGCFDEFEGTQEELDELINKIQSMADSGELFEQSRPLSVHDLLDELSDEEIEELFEEVEHLSEKKVLH